MDLHRLADEKRLAYYLAISERLRREPGAPARARPRGQGWLEAGDRAPFYARKWAEILTGDLPSIAAFLIERSELADELRQSSPFAGVLRPQERWQIWRETRDRFSPRP